jgi:CheY-like chemotaxis protein
MALVLHELITNAAKYGALSNENGTVDLHWWHDLGEHERLNIRWCEQGGPTVHCPDRKGFGTTVISASVERQLGGTLRYDWRPIGLCCDMSLPSKELADREVQLPVLRAPQQAQANHYREKSLAVLVVEDEPLIALQIAQLLAEGGCRVIGPAATVGEALELMGGADFDAALLDVDLNGARSFPIADLLGEQGKPFGFMSGFGVSELPARFQYAPLLSKPLCPKELRFFVARAASGQAGFLPRDTTALQKRLL